MAKGYKYMRPIAITLSAKGLSLDVGDYVLNLQLIPNLNASTNPSLQEKQSSFSENRSLISQKRGLRRNPIALQLVKNDSTSRHVQASSQDSSYSYSMYSSEYSSSVSTYESEDSLDNLWEEASSTQIQHKAFRTLRSEKYENGTTRSKIRKNRHHKRHKKKHIGRQSNRHVKKLKTNHIRMKKPKKINKSDKKRQQKKHTGRQSNRPDENLKKNRIGRKDYKKIYKSEKVRLYIDNSHKFLYNNTHYSLYLKPLLEKYDLNQLWSKQMDVKRFGDKFGKQAKNKYKYQENEIQNFNVFDKNTITQNTSDLNRLKNKSDLIFRQKISDGKKEVNINFYDLLKFYLNLPDLAKLQAISNPGKGQKTHLSISFPTQWIGKLKNVSDVAFEKPNAMIQGFKNNTINSIQNMKKNATKKIQEMKFNATSKMQAFKNNTKNAIQVIKKNLTNSIQAFKNKTSIAIGNIKNATQLGAHQLWQQLVQPILIDKAKEAAGKKITNTQQKISNITGSVGRIVKGPSNLWQPWIHRVKDDVKINSFINHILNHNIKLFHILAKRSKDKGWKKYIKTVAKCYEDKFREYMAETEQHKIKSRIGTERVVLNSIDVSNRIIVRLFNYIMNEMEHKNVLRTSEVPVIIAKRITDETNSVLRHACSKLSICKRSRKSFIDFFGNVMTTYSSLNGEPFEEASYALVIAVLDTDFTNALGKDNDKGLRKQIGKFEAGSYIFRKAAVNIMKNIIMKRNSPLVVYGDRPVIGTVEGTVALLEFMDVLNEKVPDDEENLNSWQTIRAGMEEYARNPDYKINKVMSDFIQHFKHVIEEIDSDSCSKLQKHARNFL